MPNHPMQPIIIDDSGTTRFKENKIVSLLLETSRLDLNALSMMLAKDTVKQEDYTHLMQLIGYSVSGYGDLSTSPENLVEMADQEAGRLLKEGDDNGA